MVILASDPELRRTGLGGTDLSRILGMSRFGGPMDVYLEKRGMTAPLIETEPMLWGKLLEEPIARQYAEKSGRKVRRAAAFLRHPAADFMYANIDRWSLLAGTPKRVLECKTTSVFTADDFGEEGTDQVPDDYLVQLMHYLNVTDTEVGDLAVLIGGNRHKVYEIPRDDELVKLMNEEAEKFWRDTQQAIPPEVDGSDASKEYLRLTYRDKGSERPMTADLALMATAYAGITAEIKDAEARRKVLGNKIRDLMGNDQWAEGEGVRVIYSARQGNRRTLWDQLVKAHNIPESAVQEFTTRDEPTRALTVTIKPA
jgi:putative phage-type endonuclease